MAIFLSLQYFWNRVYVASTILCNVTFAVAIKPISTLVFCSDKPLKVDQYFRRFAAKVHGILKLFKVLLDPVEGKRIIYKTRKMHALAVKRLDNVGHGRTLPEMLVIKEEPWMKEAAEAIKKDMEEISSKNEKIPQEVLENLSWEAKVPFSQFSLVYFTTAFFGVVWQQPQLFGMTDRNDRKMKGIIHIWAIMVKMLGLKDEYNIYIKPDSEVIDRVVREIYVHSLHTIDPMVIFLIGKVTEAINNHVPVLTVNGTMCLTMKALGCKKLEHIWKVMSIKDKIMYYGVGWLIYLGGTRTAASRFQNWLMKKILDSVFIKILGKHD